MSLEDVEGATGAAPRCLAAEGASAQQQPAMTPCHESIFVWCGLSIPVFCELVGAWEEMLKQVLLHWNPFLAWRCSYKLHWYPFLQAGTSKGLFCMQHTHLWQRGAPMEISSASWPTGVPLSHLGLELGSALSRILQIKCSSLTLYFKLR